MPNRPSDQSAAAQIALIEKILQDPLLLRRLGDRVYQLMLEDMRWQSERRTRR